MPTLTTHTSPLSLPPPTLHVALDLGNRTWCLACARAVADAPRLRTVPARDLTRLHHELTLARRHLALAADAPVLLCYEAGRDGFWLQRACTAAGITAVVVDSSSIEVPRRARRAKTDRLDATALLRLLVRHGGGERRPWHVLHVPSVEEEDRRHAHRELARLTRERTRGVNGIKGLLASHGIRLTTLRGLPDQLPQITQWDGQPLPRGVSDRLLTTWVRLQLAVRQRAAFVRTRLAWLEQTSDPAVAMVQRLLQLRGVGEVSAWLLAMELFSWRRFRNRRQVAGILKPNVPVQRRAAQRTVRCNRLLCRRDEVESNALLTNNNTHPSGDHVPFAALRHEQCMNEADELNLGFTVHRGSP